jgi:transposase-like protein
MLEPGSDFLPPFCPNPECDFHLDSEAWRFKKDGFHLRHYDDRRIQRYRCHHCGRSFSSQTFSTTYWLKRPDLLLPVLHGLIACSGFRQIARSQSVSPSAVEGQAARIGRHMLLFHERSRPKSAPGEPVILDGFETFEFSQYWPTHLNTVVGAESQFIYSTTAAELRRKGTHTARQKIRRSELEDRHGRPDPKSIEKTTAEALALAVPPSAGETLLHTDEHKAYPRALRRLGERRFKHVTTSSKRPRMPQNPLQPVNTLHALMRHSGANHKRETIAWSKRRQSMIWRDCLVRVWRNYVKHISEQKKNESPAMRLGIVKRRLRWRDVLIRRLFVTQQFLAKPLDDYFWGRVPTRQIENCRVHGLRYAF